MARHIHTQLFCLLQCQCVCGHAGMTWNSRQPAGGRRQQAVRIRIRGWTLTCAAVKDAAAGRMGPVRHACWAVKAKPRAEAAAAVRARERQVAAAASTPAAAWAAASASPAAPDCSERCRRRCSPLMGRGGVAHGPPSVWALLWVAWVPGFEQDPKPADTLLASGNGGVGWSGLAGFAGAQNGGRGCTWRHAVSVC